MQKTYQTWVDNLRTYFDGLGEIKASLTQRAADLAGADSWPMLPAIGSHDELLVNLDWQRDAVQRGIEATEKAAQVDQQLQFLDLTAALPKANASVVQQKRQTLWEKAKAIFDTNPLFELWNALGTQAFETTGQQYTPSAFYIEYWLAPNEEDRDQALLDFLSKLGQKGLEAATSATVSIHIRQQQEHTDNGLFWRHPDIKRGAKLPRAWIS